MFQDRSHAGRALAKEFKKQFEILRDPLIIALPRGGVPIGYEISLACNIPMDVIAVKKISAPFDIELALGAITENGDVFINENVSSYYEMEKKEENLLCQEAQAMAILQGKRLRDNKPHISIDDRSVILVDDGIATGATVKAVIKYLKSHRALKIVLAMPVCSEDTWEILKNEVDEFFVLDMPAPFIAVGRHYISFPQVTDEEAISLLKKSRTEKRKPASNDTAL